MAWKGEERAVEESATEMVQIILPNDTNPLGNALGGRVMHWIDLVSAIAAYKHSRRPVVTVAMERLEFIHPIRLGHVVKLQAQLHYVGNTSMEVGVKVYAEDIPSGTSRLSSQAMLTFVALDDHGRPTPVPRLRLRTEEERRLFEAAEARRSGRAR